ncbi:MAG: hypothetical protein WDN06_05660 [Asticcacaulis sp.]
MSPDSFEALLEKWWLWLAVQHYSNETVVSRKASIKGFIEWCHERGLTRPCDISKPVLERYQRHLYTYRKADGQPLSHGTQTGRVIGAAQLLRLVGQAEPYPGRSGIRAGKAQGRVSPSRAGPDHRRGGNRA